MLSMVCRTRRRATCAAALVGALLAGALIASCGSGPSRPNIVLIVIDTLRADHLGCYGYKKDTAPFLSELAQRGVLFENAHSTSSWTAPATASLLTSLHPRQHGVHTGLVATQQMLRTDPQVALNRVPEDALTAAEVFREAGYSTWGVSDNVNVCQGMGFTQGFDHFQELVDLGADKVNAAVRGWQKELGGGQPYFLYLHYTDPHRPYRPRAPWYQQAQGELLNSIAEYDSEIRFVDENIRELHDLLRWNRKTWIVIVSDHGEEFQDHGGWDHGRTLYAEVLDVPLLICPPAGTLKTDSGEASGGRTGAGAARRVAQHVSLLDVLPTLRSIAGLPAGPAEQGVSLISAVLGGKALPGQRRMFAELHSPPWYGMKSIKAVIQNNHKYVITLPDEEELYDLAADPGEQRSLVAQRESVVRDLRAQLGLFEAEFPMLAPDSVRTTLDPELIEKLRSLGYVK
jgi:arylsulfatase A-like enzyme